MKRLTKALDRTCKMLDNLRQAFEMASAGFAWLKICYNRRAEKQNEISLENALAEFPYRYNQLSESLDKIQKRPKQTGWQNERSFLLCAFTTNQLMQAGRKRKLEV